MHDHLLAGHLCCCCCCCRKLTVARVCGLPSPFTVEVLCPDEHCCRPGRHPWCAHRLGSCRVPQDGLCCCCVNAHSSCRQGCWNLHDVSQRMVPAIIAPASTFSGLPCPAVPHAAPLPRTTTQRVDHKWAVKLVSLALHAAPTISFLPSRWQDPSQQVTWLSASGWQLTLSSLWSPSTWARAFTGA